MKRLLWQLSVGFFLCALASSAYSAEVASFQILCREVLDLATYDVKFDKNIQLARGEKWQTRVDLWAGSPSELQTEVSFKLRDVNTNVEGAYLEVSWENFYDGRSVEARSKTIHLFLNEQTWFDLSASMYPYFFRNTCSIKLASL